MPLIHRPVVAFQNRAQVGHVYKLFAAVPGGADRHHQKDSLGGRPQLERIRQSHSIPIAVWNVKKTGKQTKWQVY